MERDAVAARQHGERAERRKPPRQGRQALLFPIQRMGHRLDQAGLPLERAAEILLELMQRMQQPQPVAQAVDHDGLLLQHRRGALDKPLDHLGHLIEQALALVDEEFGGIRRG